MSERTANYHAHDTTGAGKTIALTGRKPVPKKKPTKEQRGAAENAKRLRHLAQLAEPFSSEQ